MWALFAAHFANTWTLYVLLSWLPSYLREVQHMSIGAAGISSAGPWMAMFLMMYAGAAVTEWVIGRTGSVATARKLIQRFACCWAPGGAAAQRAGLATLAGDRADGAVHRDGLARSRLVRLLGELPRHGAPRRSAMLFAVGGTHSARRSGVVGVTIAGWLIDVTGAYTAAFALAAGVTFSRRWLCVGLWDRRRPRCCCGCESAVAEELHQQGDTHLARSRGAHVTKHTQSSKEPYPTAP